MVTRQLGLEVQNTEKLMRELVTQFRESFEKLSEDIRSGEVDIESVLLSMSRDAVSKEGVVLEGRSALLVLDMPADLKVFLFREERIAFLAGEARNFKGGGRARGRQVGPRETGESRGAVQDQLD